MRTIMLVNAGLILSSVACSSVQPPADHTRQAGEYARAAGLEVPSLALGSRSFQLRQTVGGNRRDREGHSSDYLPLCEGPLARKKDESVADIALRLVDRCDIFRDEVRAAALADLPTSRKFDSALEVLTGRNPNYTDYYLHHHYRPGAPRWKGLCHSWAPAGVLEPVAQLVWSDDLIVGHQPTGRGDLRELVTATLPSVDDRFIGQRNMGDGLEDESTDLDLADVVAALTWAIRDHDYGLVIDVTHTSQVWNQPVDRYAQSVTDAGGARAVHKLIPPGGTAKRIRLEIPYALEADYAHRGATRRRTLQLDGYLIEDGAGEVVDSLWITPTRDHPDFLWIPTGLFWSNAFEMLNALYQQGTKVSDVAEAAELCDRIDGFAETIGQGGVPAAAEAMRRSLTAAAEVIDAQKLDRLIISAATAANIDPALLRAAVTDS